MNRRGFFATIAAAIGLRRLPGLVAAPLKPGDTFTMDVVNLVNPEIHTPSFHPECFTLKWPPIEIRPAIKIRRPVRFKVPG